MPGARTNNLQKGPIPSTLVLALLYPMFLERSVITTCYHDYRGLAQTAQCNALSNPSETATESRGRTTRSSNLIAIEPRCSYFAKSKASGARTAREKGIPQETGSQGRRQRSKCNSRHTDNHQEIKEGRETTRYYTSVEILHQTTEPIRLRSAARTYI